MDIAILTQQLIDSRLMRTVEEFETFERVLIEIRYLEDINHMPYLCKAFDDETECPEVMFNIIHVIEDYSEIFSIKEYLEMLISSTPMMFLHAKTWLVEINIRLLNNKNYYKLYKKLIKESDKSIQNIVIEILNEIKLEYVNNNRFDKQVDEIILYLTSNN